MDVLEGCLERLSIAAFTGGPLPQEMEGVLQALRDELCPAATGAESFDDDRPRTQGGSSLLQHSFDEARRRCGALTEDLAVHVMANEELLTALNGAKDANSSLHDQLNAQADSLERLHEQESHCEERCEQLLRNRTQQQAQHVELAEERLASLNERIAAAAVERSSSLEEETTSMKQKIEYCFSDIQSLQRIRHELRELAVSPQALLASLTDKIAAGVTTHVQFKIDKVSSIEPELETAKADLLSVQKARQEDWLEWSMQQVALTCCSEDMCEQSERDTRRLVTQLTALEGALAAERASGNDDRAMVEASLEHRRMELAEKELALTRLGQAVLQVEAADAHCLTELGVESDALVELRQNMRESADAFSAATLNQEHLVRQFADHQKTCADTILSTTDWCKSIANQRLLWGRKAIEAEEKTRAGQETALNEMLMSKRVELEKLVSHLGSVRAATSAVVCESNSYRRSFETSCELRRKLEEELKDLRKKISRERLQMHSTVDELTTASRIIKNRFEDVGQRMAERQQTILDDEMQQSRQFVAKQNMLEEALTQLDERNACLAQVSALLRDENTENERLRSKAIVDHSWSGRSEPTQQELMLKREIQQLSGQFQKQRHVVTVQRAELLRCQTRHEKDAAELQESFVACLQFNIARARDGSSDVLDRMRRDVSGQDDLEVRIQERLTTNAMLLSRRRRQLTTLSEECRQEDEEVHRMQARLETDLAESSEHLDTALGGRLSPDSSAISIEGVNAPVRGQRVTREIARLSDRCCSLRADADWRVRECKEMYEEKYRRAQLQHFDNLAKIRARLDELKHEEQELQSKTGKMMSTFVSPARSTLSLARSGSLPILRD